MTFPHAFVETDRGEAPHPEDFCDLCGGKNPVWWVDSDRWNMALNQAVIACPSCFVAAHEAATGMHCMWKLEPATPFRWIEDEGRPTPFVRRAEVATENERLRQRWVIARSLWRDMNHPPSKDTAAAFVALDRLFEVQP